MVNVASCRRIRIPEFGKYLLVESGILGFGIRNIAQGLAGILLTIGLIQSPSSTDKDCYPVPGIRNPWCAIQNPRLSWVT